MTGANLPSVRQQREQTRTRALRDAEWYDDMAAAYLWLVELVESATVPGRVPAGGYAVLEMVSRLHDARREAERAADDARTRAGTLGDVLARAAAHPTPPAPSGQDRADILDAMEDWTHGRR